LQPPVLASIAAVQTSTVNSVRAPSPKLTSALPQDALSPKQQVQEQIKATPRPPTFVRAATALQQSRIKSSNAPSPEFTPALSLDKLLQQSRISSDRALSPEFTSAPSLDKLLPLRHNQAADSQTSTKTILKKEAFSLHLSPMRQAQAILHKEKILTVQQRIWLGLPAADSAPRPRSPVNLEKTQLFSAAIERPAALWCHGIGPDECLPPPYGFGHLVQGAETRKIAFAVDTMCSPFSVISEKMVNKLNLSTREELITTTLAKSSITVQSSQVAKFELVIHWNGKRRTFFLEAMVWPTLPADQDIIIGMADAIDTGLIAFALPQEWRTSWLGTACFAGDFPKALRADKSMAMAMHHDLIMSEEDEDLIDISERIKLTNAHIITDASTLHATQQYWLSQFPNLNSPIPEKAHPDLPVFDPPFNAEEMQQYSTKNTQKTPRSSPKLQDRINASLGALADAKILNLHANPVGVASYVVLVPKPDGSLRICINFSRLNKILFTHHHPLPVCADLLNQLARKKFFAKVDLKNGFYNFDVAESAKWLTSTVAPGHAFTWNKIPQGLAPVPQWFQWAMQTILGSYIGTICLCYIDDLIIMADSAEELQANIRLILARLDQFNLRIAINKCDFVPNTSIEFLGHTITDGKISPGPKSSKILENIVNPNHESQTKHKIDKLGTFIGIINWFSKYIPNCSRELLPLLNARENGWTWGDEQEKAFVKFREILANLQPLHLPSGGNNRLEVHTDASKDGWFAVLFEDTGVGETKEERLKVIAYTGGVFRSSQISWSILQKEMFAVYQAHLKFDPFIRLHEFRLVIDNRTMCFCETSSDMMVMRWWLRIQAYLSEIVHVPGVTNIVPDAGSRLMHLLHPNPTEQQFSSAQSSPSPLALTSSLCPSICSLLFLGDNKKQRQNAELTLRLTENHVSSLFAGCFGEPSDANDATDDWSVRKLQVASDTTSQHSASHGSNSRSTVLLESHGSNSCSTELLDELDAASANTYADSDVSLTPSACARLMAEPSSASRGLPISPEHYHLIRQCHGGAAGHNGRDETIRKLQNCGHHWPTRFIDVARFVASCPTCQRFRLKLKHPYAMYKTIMTDAPLFGRWHCDFLTIGAPCSFTGATKVFVMREQRSRFTMLYGCKAETAIEVVIAYLNTFSIFGIPESVYSDKAQNIIAAAAKEFLELTGIRHDFSVPHQAHSNGMVESSCGEAGRLLRMLCDELHMYGKWSLMLPLIQRQLNSLFRTTLGCSANELVFGARVNLDAYILPTAPREASSAERAMLGNSTSVQAYLDNLVIAQQDILHKSNQIRIHTLNKATARRPFNPDEVPTIGTLVLVPWNDSHKRPTKLDANAMGPFVITATTTGKSTVQLTHVMNPPPAGQPKTYTSTIADLLIYNDELQNDNYDIPENRFRSLAYLAHVTRPINCILNHRRIDNSLEMSAKDVRNHEYEVRWDDASLTDTTWLRYDNICHSFAFESYYQGAHRTFTLTGHTGAAIPADERVVHQARSIAATRRRNASMHDRAVAAFDLTTMSFRDH
jgi:hypothetical protein